MNKFLATLLLGTGFGMCAQDDAVSVQRKMEEARVVQIVITAYRSSKNFDADAWKQIIEDIAHVIQIGNSKGNQGGEFITRIAKFLPELHDHVQDKKGVQAQVKVGFGNGECPENRCSEDCVKLHSYEGACPCSAFSDASCK